MRRGSGYGRTVTLLCLTAALGACAPESEYAESMLDIAHDGGYAAVGDEEWTDDSALALFEHVSALEKRPLRDGDQGFGRTPANAYPELWGIPAESVVSGAQYRFAPDANDADGDNLAFRVENKPSWASFDSATGELTGTPQYADVGTYSNIVVEVSDGETTTKLAPFTITVQAIGYGTATLTWAAPTERSDGSALSDLVGYRIYWGQESRNYTASVEIYNPATTTYVVDNLGSGTYYFVATAISADGVESPLSDEMTKTIP